MNTSRWLAILIFVLVGTGSAAGADPSLMPLKTNKLLGWWRGGDTNDLNCILTFDEKLAKIHTFRRDKHLSTVNAWYRIEPTDRVTLGINGQAMALPDGRLQLKLTRQFDHIVVLREAVLQRMPGKNERESLR